MKGIHNMNINKNEEVQNLVEQFRLIIKESNIDLYTAKSIGNIINKLIKMIGDD